jgi:4-hydroxy-2-oxoheptanedioate aldolase
LKENPVKRALKAGKPQIGTWLSLGSIAAARFMARAGFPWLTVDMEHTHTDIQTAAFMFGAIADAGCVPLARIPTGRHDLIKMVLDCGAMGIVAPMVMDAAEARSIVAATKYPPRGNRSVGGGMHALNFGARRNARPELRGHRSRVLQQGGR